MVDVVFADVAQPDQARIVAINAHHFLKNQGHFVISIKVCILCQYCVLYLSRCAVLQYIFTSYCFTTLGHCVL